MSNKTFSLLRRYQYERLGMLTMNGKLLDIGGGKKGTYRELIKGQHTFDVADIQEEDGVDFVFDAQEAFPFDDAVYDGVILVNVLEHLFDYQNAVNESYRVLTTDGVLVGTTPFLFNVHGSPSDYFRYTKPALEEILRRAGFRDIRVSELGTGAFSVAYHLFYGFYRFSFVKELFIRVMPFLDGLTRFIKPHNQCSELHMPLGYFFEARK